MNPPETRFRTLWISDTHLGARTSQPDDTGDWMDSCTALVEPHRGPIRLVRWFKPREQTVPATVPLLEHGVAATGG